MIDFIMFSKAKYLSNRIQGGKGVYKVLEQTTGAPLDLTRIQIFFFKMLGNCLESEKVGKHRKVGQTVTYILFVIQRCGHSNCAEWNQEHENVISFLIGKLSSKILIC